MSGFTIGELARRSGVHLETIRYYHRVGLLPVPPRGEAGPRRYGKEALERLVLIRRARKLTFSIAEIGRLVAVHERRSGCAEAKAVTAARLAEVEREVSSMQGVCRELSELVQRCDAIPAADGDPCPVVEHLIRGERAPE